ncbi:hypothetical protein GCM10011529_00830 [Polymorphobacter glacialis]|uniref:Activator of Hsp90 ATPase homologue 1/2-like C-terminal domain-containing protein n=1 Tax=Sandarakinorhabdus glacialis TaxID=1614636 RepID=A0A916ZHZ8_9SPHN|nr:SRPBCC domain-containing protein [Polymorphobacter glacialis]GGD98611.1 hypothetical protein GCM10011529_00830 [Polymorphobacter glacialis]
MVDPCGDVPVLGGFELAVERHIAASPEVVWRAMTEHLPEWWCPQPWRTEVHAIEWRAGGVFHMTMHGPDGETAGGPAGVLLEVRPGGGWCLPMRSGRDGCRRGLSW